MFCGECGTQNPDTNQFCKNCGKALRRPQQAPVPQPAAVPVPPVAAPPVAQPVYYPPPQAGAQPQGIPPEVPAGYALIQVASTTDKLLTVAAIIGVIVSIVAWVRYPYLCGIGAILIGAGVLYKVRSKKSKTAIVAILAIIIALACIIFDLFYLMIIPPVPPVL
ncbi:MAG: zinc ribbon domain-containing protein [Methanoregula sp.]|jgi:hypothetical protein